MSPSKTVKSEIELFIDQNGDVHAIHNDYVDGLDLGAKTVTRASSVEFDNEHQVWYADIPESTLFKGKIRITDPSRNEVLKVEAKLVSAIIEHEICQEPKNQIESSEAS
jgi:hypothetical protein